MGARIQKCSYAHSIDSIQKSLDTSLHQMFLQNSCEKVILKGLSMEKLLRWERKHFP